jgi:hypothetical protein
MKRSTLDPALVRRPLRAAGGALAVALGLVGCGGESPPAMGAVTFPATPFMTVASDVKRLSVDVHSAPTQPPARGVSDLEYVITDGNGAPLRGLTLSVTPWMPDMGHGSAPPTVEELGDGHYLLSQVSMFMAGRWQLRTTVTAPLQDTVTPELRIE